MGRAVTAVFLVGLVLLFTPSQIVNFPSEVHAAWLSGWSYRRAHAINEQLGAGTNYPIRFTVYYGAGATSGGNLYLDGECRADFGDVRFTDDDGITLLDYWIESKTDSNNAVFWVEVKDNLNVNPATVVVYYGNSGATSVSNFAATFIDTDDFEDGTNGQPPAGWTTSAGITLTVSTTSTYVNKGTKGLRCLSNGGTSANPAYRPLTTITGDNNTAIEFWIKVVAEEQDYYQYVLLTDGATIKFYFCMRWPAGGTRQISYHTGAAWVDVQAWTLGTWYRIKIYNIDFTNRKFDMDIDGVKKVTRDTFFAAATQFTRFNKAAGGHAVWDEALDTLFVRKCLAVEPSHGGWGPEQHLPTITSPADFAYNEGSTKNNLTWKVVSGESASNAYTVYRNSTFWASGTWTNNTNFNVSVDACAAPFGWNFTINAMDACGNVTDTAIVTVNAVQPSINHPSDQSWTYGTGGHTIDWTVTDPGSPTGTYQVYRNSTLLNPGGNAWSNNTNIAWGIDGLGVGIWNYTIQFWDGNCSAPYPTDLVWITVGKATPTLELYFNGTAGNKNYLLGQMMNLTGTVTPALLVVVVEFAGNGTDISVPAAGVSTIVIDSNDWGIGSWLIRAHTDGNANYTAANSATRTLSILAHLMCNSPSDFSYGEGSVGNQIGWQVNSSVDLTHFYTIYKDTVWYASGNWTNATLFNIDVDGLPVGTLYNFTLNAMDSLENVTDTVFVNVTDVLPTVNHPADFGYTYGIGGNTIDWVVTDPGSPTGSYTVEKNGTDLGGPWTWQNNTNIAFNVDGLPAGVWNFTGYFWDGNSTANVTDIVFVTVGKATPTLGMYLNGTAGNKTYVICQMMNLTGNVTPATLTVVVRFTNGTAISVPAVGVSTVIVDSNVWGSGDFLVVAYTAGNANYTAANSTVRKITITNTPPSLNAPADQNMNEGLQATIPWLVIDLEHNSGTYTVYRNTSFHGAGAWTNNTLISYLSSFEWAGVWNYTIVVSDGWATDSDMVLLNVSDILPTVNSPADINYVLGTTGHTIGWIITDPGSSAGNYTVERNATDLGGPWIWINNTNLNFNVDGFGIGLWNVTIIVWDEFSASNVTDLVWVNVSAAVLKLIAQAETNPWIIGTSGWINLTLNHSLGWANLSLVDLQVNTTGDAQSFVLRWNRTGYTLVEISDPAAICTLVSWSNTTGTYNVTIRIKITITGGTSGWCDKRVNATGDGGADSDDFVLNAFLLGAVPTINHPPDLVYPEGSIGNVIPWMVNSTADPSGNYTVYLNAVWYTSGIWNNHTTINVNVDGRPVGINYNFTIDAQGSIGNVTDTVFVNVTAVQPSVNHPADFSYTYGAAGNTIGWIVTDPGSPTGNYTVDRNGTHLGGPWVWTNNTNIAFNVDGLGVGVWNFTGFFWDGNCTSNTTDIVFVTVTKAAPTLHIYANGTEAAKTYYLGENMNITGTVSPAILSVTTEFLNGTVIGGPSLGINTTVILAATWGMGSYQIRSHTVGSANYSAGYSVTITVTISSASVHLYINTTEADAFFNLSQIMNLTGVVYPAWLNVTVEFLNGTVISGPSLGVNKTYINTSDWGEGVYEVRAHGHASGIYPDSYSVTLTISIGREIEEWVIADVAANWWVFAYLLSTFTVFMALEEGRLRSGLMNIFLGFPAALWMLAMQSGIVNGGPMVLMLSVISPVAQIGVGMTNLFASALGGREG